MPPFLNPAVLKHIRRLATRSAALWGQHRHSCSYFLKGRAYAKTAFDIKCGYIFPENFVRNILFAVNSEPCERPMSACSGSSKTIHSVLRQAVLTATSEKQLLLRR
jgi:hypothetical protein